jgi:thiosulfate/3-mercaptopyruvate sulfurtransferase
LIETNRTYHAGQDAPNDEESLAICAPITPSRSKQAPVSHLALFLLLGLSLILGACAAPAALPAVDTGQTIAVEAPTGYASPDALVDTQWVVDHLDDADVRLLDVSSSHEVFEQGHLPGAQFVDWQTDLTNPDDPVRGQILSQQNLSDLMSRLGVEPDDTVVFYDETSNLFAARAYWVLKYYQHPDVRVYNGGSKKWTADGQTLTKDVAVVEPSQYTADDADPEIRTTWQYVVEHIDDPSTLLCDARSPSEYNGTDVRSARGGHVPGAINVEWSEAVDADGTFRSAEALTDLYSEAGFTPDKEIITYCQTGVRGAHTWFVLSELLGYPSVRTYDGSWEEYGNY